jgi:hypothetical protein
MCASLGKFFNNGPKEINVNDGGTQIKERGKKRNVSKKNLVQHSHYGVLLMRPLVVFDTPH